VGVTSPASLLLGSSPPTSPSPLAGWERRLRDPLGGQAFALAGPSRGRELVIERGIWRQRPAQARSRLCLPRLDHLVSKTLVTRGEFEDQPIAVALEGQLRLG